ncbi:competence protein ComK [Saliterribacillus persicus]|uniref:Competence protein ComK n=1 Tax=Saliterribacillus persicus TaxID=930114 RepID=A0A368XT58_9BACI|nr:competence protein ComK [Saliterribacillus persicus]RCW69697.1 competence protein ComK [Saliterribacillus persicus]
MLYESLRVDEVTPDTLAVIGKKEDGKYVAKIMEWNEENDYESEFSARQILDTTCRFFGSSLQGRLDGTKMITGITHKPPVVINGACGMYFFPVASPLHPDCIWIAHSHIDRLERLEHRSTRILFKNGRFLELEVSYPSLVNQLHRTAQYRYLLDNRTQEPRKEPSDMVAEMVFEKRSKRKQ